MLDFDLKMISMMAGLVSLAFPLGAPLIVSVYRVFLGTLYPAYASYKAIRNKDVKEYVSRIFQLLHTSLSLSLSLSLCVSISCRMEFFHILVINCRSSG